MSKEHNIVARISCLSPIFFSFGLLSIGVFAQEAQLVPDPVTVETGDSQGADSEGVGTATIAPSLSFIPFGTAVMIQLDAPVSSRTAVRGDMFPISLAEPVSVNGVEIIPVGVSGEGQVVHAQGRGLGGRAGELIVAARYIMWGNRRIPLRSMRISLAGRNNTAEALAVSSVIPLAGFLVTGTSVDLPLGQIAIARFAEDVPVQPPVPLPSDSTSQAGAEAAPAAAENDFQQGGKQ